MSISDLTDVFRPGGKRGRILIRATSPFPIASPLKGWIKSSE
jgi:hypothetical protein